MVFKNYYKILDLETSRVSIEQIKNAYRIAAKKYHPDVNIGDELSEEKIKDINEAYRVLSVPSSKRKYDRVWNSKFGKAKKAFIGEDRNNAIKNIFLGNTEKENTNDEKVRDLKPIKGESIETSINATIHEAFFGLDKKIQLRSVDGKNKNFIITIPKGIKNGEKLRLIGQGKEGKKRRKKRRLIYQNKY